MIEDRADERENQFGCQEIENHELTLEAIPDPDASPLHELLVFGLHFDGYARFGLPYCGQLANAAAQRFRETGELPEALTDLRVCLFFEQRRAHHAGRPDELGEAFVRALVRAIREKVARVERD